MTTASAQAFRRVTTVAWPQRQEADAKALLLKVAKTGHARIMQEQTARAGIAPDFNAYANTPRNENLESVKLPGPIVYRYRYFREIIHIAMALLKAASPVRTGAYAAAHVLYVNGAQVPAGTLPIIRASDEIMIVNTVPYARKIEVGKTKAGRSFTIQESQSMVYTRVADKLRSQYRQIVAINFEFVSLSNAYNLMRDQPTRRFSRGGFRKSARISKDRRAGSAITYPALVIRAA